MKRTISISAFFLAMLAIVLYASLHKEEKVAPVVAPSVVAEISPKPIDSSPTVCGNFFKAACENKKVFRDPTGVVDPDVKGEIEALRLYETIMHKHRDWTSQKVEADLVRQIYTKKRVEQLRSTFDWVKTEIHKFIERQPAETFSETERTKMLRELDRTVLELPPPANIYFDELDLLTKNDVYFEQTPTGKKRMRVGGAYLLAAKSWFNQVFTFAHELSHSIDPCEMKFAGVHVHAYDRLESCLLNKKVIHKTSNWSACGDTDQFPEAFADWIAASITAESFVREIDQFHSKQDRESAAINAVKDICDEGSSWVEIDTVLHPPPRARVEGIFGSNQEVRRFLDCRVPRKSAEPCSFGRK